MAEYRRRRFRETVLNYVFRYVDDRRRRQRRRRRIQLLDRIEVRDNFEDSVISALPRIKKKYDLHNGVAGAIERYLAIFVYDNFDEILLFMESRYDLSYYHDQRNDRNNIE